MTIGRIEEIQKQTYYPKSISVHNALIQVANEIIGEFKNRTCKNCKHYMDDGEYPDDKWCAIGISIDDDINMIEPTFGCNKFVSKGT